MTFQSEMDSKMDLILWRHAEAIDLELVGDDMTRTLTPRGEKQAARMASWLDRQLPGGARVWASPALRAERISASQSAGSRLLLIRRCSMARTTSEAC
jgi:phosphohistidine phosphatase SixA